MSTKEKNLINKRLVNLKPNERLFRINAGMGWVATKENTIRINRPMTVKVDKGDVVLKHARVFWGAPEGWHDLCGWTEIEITPDMVGKSVAVFTFEEYKTGRLTLSDMQKKFRDIIVKMGGIFREVRGN